MHPVGNTHTHRERERERERDHSHGFRTHTHTYTHTNNTHTNVERRGVGCLRTVGRRGLGLKVWVLVHDMQSHGFCI